MPIVTYPSGISAIVTALGSGGGGGAGGLTEGCGGTRSSNEQIPAAWAMGIAIREGPRPAEVVFFSTEIHNHEYGSTKVKLEILKQATRRANAQIIHIHHSYKTSLQTAPIHIDDCKSLSYFMLV